MVAPPGALSWVETEGRKIPENAIEGGYDASGNPLYIGRITYEKAVIVGSVDSNGLGEFPYGLYILTCLLTTKIP